MTKKVLRDAFIDRVSKEMALNEHIFFISADFGAPALDELRIKYEKRFINVGIAEQNLINICTGLALEGFVVYAYAIAPFLSMRAYEQIRNNLSIMSQIRDININLISVGAGLSYDVTGPTHHCLEDSCIMNVLPNITLFSPSDAVLAEKFVAYTLNSSGPKYIRFDGKALPVIYGDDTDISFKRGFTKLLGGNDVCIFSTGYMTHIALETARQLRQKGISASVIDTYMLKPLNESAILSVITGFGHLVTMEESFLNKGGLDSMIERICFENEIGAQITKFGFQDKYIFDVGNREYLYQLNKMSPAAIVDRIIKDVENPCVKYRG